MIGKTSVFDVSLIELPKNHAEKGNITAVNTNTEIPFNINRIYYLYDVPGGTSRGGHAHKELQQLIFAVSGSFDITLDDGCTKRSINLNRPYLGLYMPAGLWRELDNFSSGSICLVLASHTYDPDDYIRNYSYFKEFKRH